MLSKILAKIFAFLSLIRWEHTIFSLPTFLAGALVAQGIWPPLERISWILLAGISARAGALGFNRLIDQKVDALNPRTRMRELPQKKLTPLGVGTAIAMAFSLYLFSAYHLGYLPLILSPIPIVVFILYPFLKHLTPLCHYGVGLGLSLAPLGASVAAWDAIPTNPEPYLLAGFTFFWVAGFDILYSFADLDFDRRYGIHSLPARFGIPAGRLISAITHLGAFILITLLIFRYNQGMLALIASISLLFLFILQHLYWRHTDFAFFKVNAILGVIAGGWIILIAHG